MSGLLTIGKIARGAGVSIQTIRYYERRGLLRPSDRRDSGYRLYAPDAVDVLRFVKNAQELGFSLDEITKLLRLRVGPGTKCGRVKKQAQARLVAVQAKIAGLRAMECALRRLISTCVRRGTTDYCPILKSIENGRRSP